MERTERFKFTTDYIIAYDSLSGDSNANYIQLMNIAQETSMRHSAHSGLGIDYYAGKRQGWVITRWDAVFHEYPRWNGRVTGSTWPSLFKGFVADRSFVINFPDGRPIMTAYSSWVFFDLDKRAPLRPDKEHTAKYGPVFPPAHAHDFSMADVFAEEGGFELVSSRAKTVTRTDIDTNGHVNNVKYIAWAYDNAVSGGNISRLKVSYKKECALGERIIIESYVNVSGGVNALRMKNESGVPVAELDLYLG